MQKKQNTPVDATELRRRAELQLKARRKFSTPSRTEADTLRINHELEVHQIELESKRPAGCL